MKNDEKVRLEHYTIHELRQLGRSYGVKSPSTRSKGDLIEQILGILSGDVLPVITKRGRPTSERDIERWIIKSQMPAAVASLGDISIDYETGLGGEERMGYILLGKQSAEVKNQEGISTLIRMETIEKYGLLSGDEVQYVSMPVSGQPIHVVIEVLKINGVSVNEFARGEEFERLAAVYPDRNLSFGNSALLSEFNAAACGVHGMRAALIFDDRRLLNETFFDVARSLPVMHKVEVFLEQPAEALAMIRSEFADASFTRYDASYQENIDIVDFAADKAKRFAERGEDVVLMFDLEKYLHAFGLNYCSGVVAAKKIIGLGRSLDKGSLSVICCMTKNIENYFTDIFTHLVYVENGKCDKKRSYARIARKPVEK